MKFPARVPRRGVQVIAGEIPSDCVPPSVSLNVTGKDKPPPPPPPSGKKCTCCGGRT